MTDNRDQVIADLERKLSDLATEFGDFRYKINSKLGIGQKTVIYGGEIGGSFDINTLDNLGATLFLLESAGSNILTLTNPANASGDKSLLLLQNLLTTSTKYALEIDVRNNKNGLYIHETGNALQNESLLQVTNTSAHASRSAGASAVTFSNTGKGGTLYLTSDSQATGSELMIEHNTSTEYPIAITQNNSVSTNFKKYISCDGTVIWKSDGSTTPNGNLSGSAGDICLNGDSGNIYRCTGTTNWTAM